MADRHIRRVGSIQPANGLRGRQAVHDRHTDIHQHRFLREMLRHSFCRIAAILFSACELRPKGEQALAAALMNALAKQGGAAGFAEQVLANYRL